MPEPSPLHQLTQTAGATFAEYQGWLMPASFGDVASEDTALRSGAAMVDLSHRSKVGLYGKDRATFLHNFCTNEIIKAPVGAGCEAFLTTHQAKILAWLQISIGVEEITFHAEPGLSQKIITYLDRYLITEEVEFMDRTTEEALLFVTGPQAATKLDAPGDLHHRQHRLIQIGTAHVRVERNDMYGQPGFFLGVPRAEVATAWQSLLEKGIQPAGLLAYEQFRVEAGVPAYGQDIDETHLPQEVDRTDEAISFTKGCYIGQETVARIRAYGHVNRLLRKLVLSRSTADHLIGHKFLHNGQEVGQVTSAVKSSRYATTVALGYLRRGHNEPGTVIDVESNEGTIPATVRKATEK